jgi:hypothetical protein
MGMGRAVHVDSPELHDHLDEEKLMRALVGCFHCGNVERTHHAFEEGVGKCPECGFPMKEVDLLAARLLARERRTASALRARVQATMAGSGRPARLPQRLAQKPVAMARPAHSESSGSLDAA